MWHANVCCLFAFSTFAHDKISGERRRRRKEKHCSFAAIVYVNYFVTSALIIYFTFYSIRIQKQLIKTEVSVLYVSSNSTIPITDIGISNFLSDLTTSSCVTSILAVIGYRWYVHFPQTTSHVLHVIVTIIQCGRKSSNVKYVT